MHSILTPTEKSKNNQYLKKENPGKSRIFFEPAKAKPNVSYFYR